ncbi:hypothetical protein K438DRAFT_1826026, partial [Mycena galopus ATCC 62051]
MKPSHTRSQLCQRQTMLKRVAGTRIPLVLSDPKCFNFSTVQAAVGVSAWFSHHSPEKYGPLDDEEVARNGAKNVVDAMLLRTELCLRNAIAIAEQPEVVGRLHPSTLPDPLTRRAAIPERLGPSQLIESRAQYDRVFWMLGRKGLQAAHISAVKLGDVSQRLGEDPDALVWWARAIQLATDNETGTHNTQKIEEGALDLLRSIHTPDSLESASPPQALHSLSLLHCSAILSLHLAEPVAECVTRLQAAATSSERVAYALVGTSVRDSDQLAPSVEEPLLRKYTKDPYLEKPAADLLRDSRRSAADIWTFLGEVKEQMGPSHRQLALDYYARAVGWAGKTNDEGVMERTDCTLEDDWMLIWRNSHRMRQAVDAESKS